jgi:hypothetical protein
VQNARAMFSGSDPIYIGYSHLDRIYRTHAFGPHHAPITDTRSLMYEYLACDKPILHQHCEGGAGLNDEGRQWLAGMSSGFD